MVSRFAPIWLAAPSRYAGWPTARARGALIVLLLLIAAFTIQPWRGAAAPDNARHDSSSLDVALYDVIVGDMRHGDDYYQAAAREMRARSYPLRPFVTVRLPTLARVRAAMPEWGAVLLLWGLVAATAAAWLSRLGEFLPARAPHIIAGLLLAGGLIAALQPALVAFHEIWAALLIAWSLAERRAGRWITAVALATSAMLIRETAALYVLVMAGFALFGGHRRETSGWCLSLLVLAAVVAFHALAVSRVTGPLDLASDGWSGLNGAWFYAMTLKHATILEVFPFAVAAPVIALALFGWTVPDHPLASRVAAMLIAYGVLIGCFARLNNFYWGLLAAPVLLVGLAFVPDGLRDLIAAARNTRRITVTRVVR
ncbi:hypothetical protein [Sphingomonas sp.]|uniref:hypothetical protein n=1 Tax=Sphingomonas sp. TaxID=28214 RepID=UPI00092A41AB|nr:hypothetical protein [Sphingomonas sp.]OJU14779.1 MAG: hypothetical protein BGN95_11980 [Sphingomonas sp. 66-10]